MHAVMAQLVQQHAGLAASLRRTLSSLTPAQFAEAPGETAPPAGWHLWHVVRWADRFQAGLASPGAPAEIWTSEKLAAAWGLDPEALGVLELGMGMDAAVARALPSMAGQERFGRYQERVLDAAHAAITARDPEELLAPRMSIREYAVVDGVLRYAPPQESTLLADILFHLTHANRHIGNVEALRGL